MNMITRTLVAAASLAALGASADAAPAFSGTFWDAPENSFATIDDAISFATSNTPTATFKSTSIAYGNAPGFTIPGLVDFLNADGGSVVGMDDGNIQESVFLLTGKTALTNGQDVTVTSDDGFRILLDGTLFEEFTGLRGPDSTTSTPFTGATGVYDLTFWYFEGQPTQAQLESNLAPVPVPAAGGLLLAALAGTAALRRRKA